MTSTRYRGYEIGAPRPGDGLLPVFAPAEHNPSHLCRSIDDAKAWIVLHLQEPPLRSLDPRSAIRYITGWEI
jgi:hypothetical protein